MATEMRWNKNWGCLSSPLTREICRPKSCRKEVKWKKWYSLIGPRVSTAIGWKSWWVCSVAYYYTALLRRRGPHIALHSVCPSVCLSVCLSVCPSVPCLFTLEHRSRVFVNLADVWYLLFCLHFRAAYRTAISAAQACYYYNLHC